jgi:hypothetical protein
MMATTPSWLYYLFGASMLAVAAYESTLLLVAVPIRRTAGWDVDISHTCMGVAMAGMFVTQWAFGPRSFWEPIFAVLFVWFLVRSIQSMRRWGLHLPHFLIHAVMSLAMLLMYRFPMVPSTASMSAMGPRLDPGLAFLLAIILFASAVFTLASPHKGASHHGTHDPALVPRQAAGQPDGWTPSHGGIAAIIGTPWLEDISHVVMCVGMGFMLILML